MARKFAEAVINDDKQAIRQMVRARQISIDVLRNLFYEVFSVESVTVPIHRSYAMLQLLLAEVPDDMLTLVFKRWQGRLSEVSTRHPLNWSWAWSWHCNLVAVLPNDDPHNVRMVVTLYDSLTAKQIEFPQFIVGVALLARVRRQELRTRQVVAGIIHKFSQFNVPQDIVNILHSYTRMSCCADRLIADIRMQRSLSLELSAGRDMLEFPRIAAEKIARHQANTKSQRKSMPKLTFH